MSTLRGQRGQIGMPFEVMLANIKQEQQASKSNILERHKASVGWMRGI